MGFGDDLLITALASKIKKQHPDRQIVVGSAEEKRAYHSLIYENNPNISDCRNLESNKPTHLINHHPHNRPYIDYERSTHSNYVWKKFKPEPGELFFSEKEKSNAKDIIAKAKNYWSDNNNNNFKKIIFLESSSTKLNDRQFGIKQKNLDWGYHNWIKLINILKDDYLIIQSAHNETKKIYGVFTPDEMEFRLACAVLNETDLYIGPHGGFGHVAAALNKKAVLYFGGWISPDTMSYDFHENIYYENKLSPCGEYKSICNHCEDARNAISVDVFLSYINKINSD